MTIRTRPMRHEAHIAPAPQSIDFEHDGAIIGDLDQGMYFRPAPGNNVFVGSTDPECDGHEWVDSMDGLNREVTEPLWNRQMMRVAKRLPEFGVPLQRRGVAEAYDVSTDWGPIYDRTDLDGFFVAIGTSGNQFKNACVASHLMSELITAVGAGHDHDHEPLVVHGRYTGTPIDMAAFSRNRAVNANSTGTVLG
jgi:sarcosine oxidase subunit beta